MFASKVFVTTSLELKYYFIIAKIQSIIKQQGLNLKKNYILIDFCKYFHYFL